MLSHLTWKKKPAPSKHCLAEGRTRAGVSGLVLHFPHFPQDIPCALIAHELIHTIKRCWSTQVRLEDALQDLPGPLQLLLVSQPPAADQSQQEGKASGPSLHTHWGFSALALHSCCSCASLLAETDTANSTGKKFCGLCVCLCKRECLHESTQ